MKNLMVLLIIIFCCSMMIYAQDIQRPNSYNYTRGIEFAREGKTSEALESFEKELTQLFPFELFSKKF